MKEKKSFIYKINKNLDKLNTLNKNKLIKDWQKGRI
jgi:hypothetical protein